MIKIVAKDALFGVLIILVILTIELILTIPFGVGIEQMEVGTITLAEGVDRKLLSTALLAAITTFVFTLKLNTKNKADALRRGIIWTIIFALYFIIVGILDGYFGEIFGSTGFYVLLICTLAGPMVYAKVKPLK